MAGLLVAAAEAVRGLQCQLLAANEYVAGAIGTINPVTRVTAPIAINGLRRLLGCNEDDDYENPPPPFTGGQCDGVVYNVDWTWLNQLGNEASAGDRIARGPIGGIRMRQSTAALSIVELLCRGTSAGNCGSTPPPLVPQQWLEFASASALRTSPSIEVLTRCSGVDDCGDVGPGEFPPPTNITNNVDVTYNIDEGNEVTVNIPFIFAPIKVNFDGTLRIPFTFDVGGVEFSGDINLGSNNDVTINPPALPTGDGQGTDTLPPGDPGDDVPPAAPDEKIIGVVVNSSIAGEQQLTTIAQQGMPSILAPRAGSIKFAYSLGGSTFWSSDIDVKTVRTFIPCPFSQGADAVVVSPAPGIVLTWLPIRGFPLATVQDVQSS